MAENFSTIELTSSLNDVDKLVVGQTDLDRATTLSSLVTYIEAKGLTLTNDITTEDILPEMTGATGEVSVRNLGSATQKFNSVYADEIFVGASSLYVNGKKVIEDAASVMTFQTDTDQAIEIKTSSSTPGTGNGNLTLQAGNEVNTIAPGGMEFTVTGVASKNIVFSNSSAGGNIQFAGDTIANNNLTVAGDLIVSGTTTTIDTATLLVEDNMITVNKSQTGTPATSLVGGMEVERGDELNYRFVFEELTDTFVIGEQGSEQAVATRETSPIDGGIAVWNDVEKRFDTVVRNYVTFTSGTSFPGSPVAGDDCFRTDLNAFFKYTGSEWIQL